MADISDIKDFRRVTKAERIFAESMREKESQVQEERWTGLGLQGWLRGNMKNVWVWLAIVVFFLRGGGSWACSSVVERAYIACIHPEFHPWEQKTKINKKQWHFDLCLVRSGDPIEFVRFESLVSLGWIINLVTWWKACFWWRKWNRWMDSMLEPRLVPL